MFSNRRNYASSTRLVSVLQEEVVTTELLLLVELRLVLVDTRSEVDGVTAEGDVEVLQESVTARQQGLGLVGVGIDTGLTIEDDDTVGEVSGHDEIVLDDKSSLLGVHDETLDDAGNNDTLLGVKIGGRLVDHVDIGWETQCKHDGDTLQFTTRQVLDFLINEVIELQGLDNIRLELWAQDCLRR